MNTTRPKDDKIIDVTCDVKGRTICVRLSGFLSEDDARRSAHLYRVATRTFAGRPHLVLADLRGLKPQSAVAAAFFGKTVAYGRENGVVCCVHLSDSIITRLQAARLASEVSGSDDITVDAASMADAERILAEKRRTLFGQ
ncbi:MAG TPA: hypothetical protein VNO21_24075 [Polyangiaceae bacterium]|nr:hypothetical protein [Polyangiaceae bacterium]